MKILRISFLLVLILMPFFSESQLFIHSKGAFERTSIKNDKGENIWLENKGKFIYYETSKEEDGYVVYRKGDPKVQAKIGKTQIFYRDAGAPNWRVIYYGSMKKEEGEELMSYANLNAITLYSESFPSGYLDQKQKLDKAFFEYDSLVRLNL